MQLDRGDSLLPAAAYGVVGNDASAAYGPQHFDNTTSYLMWAYVAKSDKHACDDSTLSS